MGTLQRLARAAQVRYLSSLILSLVLLLTPAAGAAGTAFHAMTSHSAPVIASVGGSKEGCGGAGLPC